MPLGKRFFDNLVDVILKQTDNQTEGSKVLGEYSINTSINSINLTCFNGSIRWIPLDKEEQPRIEIVKEVRGSNRQEMERILRNLRVEIIV